MPRYRKSMIVFAALLSIQPAMADNDANYVAPRGKNAAASFDPHEYDISLMPKAMRADYDQRRRTRAKEQLAKINTGATRQFGPFVSANE